METAPLKSFCVAGGYKARGREAREEIKRRKAQVGKRKNENCHHRPYFVFPRRHGHDMHQTWPGMTVGLTS